MKIHSVENLQKKKVVVFTLNKLFGSNLYYHRYGKTRLDIHRPVLDWKHNFMNKTSSEIYRNTAVSNVFMFRIFQEYVLHSHVFVHALTILYTMVNIKFEPICVLKEPTKYQCAIYLQSATFRKQFF